LFKKIRSCKFSTFYRTTEVGCEEATGCKNIFDTGLATSRIYIDPAESTGVQYLPYQIANEVVGYKNNLQLKINRPEENLNGDFCVDFGYKSKSVPLYVTANASAENFYRLEFPAKEDTAKFCASWLSNDVRSVKSIYFQLPKAPIID